MADKFVSLSITALKYLNLTFDTIYLLTPPITTDKKPIKSASSSLLRNLTKQRRYFHQQSPIFGQVIVMPARVAAWGASTYPISAALA